jgi:hypothetical protein
MIRRSLRPPGSESQAAGEDSLGRDFKHAVSCCAVKISSRIEDYARPGTSPRPVCEGVQHTLCPASFSVWGELKDCTVAISASLKRRPIQVSRLIEDQACVGRASVPAFKRVEYRLRPPSTSVWGQLEDRAALTSAT